jgi:hypothetical protein
LPSVKEKREQELVEINGHINSIVEPQATVLLTGDFNFDREDEVLGSLNILNGFIDSYRNGNPMSMGYTYNRATNPLVGYASHRNDLVYIKGRKAHPIDARLVFNEPGTEPISDHFGVQVDVMLHSFRGGDLKIPKDVIIEIETLLGFKFMGISPEHIQESSPAMNVRGGIDFNLEKMDLEVKNQEGLISFELDQAQLERFKYSAGLVPFIINIQPVQNLQRFLETAGSN